MANFAICSICHTAISIDATTTADATIFPDGSLACRSCVADRDRAVKEATDGPRPSAASVAMMRALADRLMFSASTAAELVRSSVQRGLDALIAGDFLGFVRASYEISDAIGAVTSSINESTTTDAAIRSLDPNYHAFVLSKSQSLAVAHERKRFAGVDVVRLLAHFASAITSGAPSTHIEALKEELKSRGIEVPK